MRITKTDFLHYLNCPESFRLYKKRPDEYPIGEFTLFQEKIIKEGYEVESYAIRLFPDGIAIPESESPEYTSKILDSGGTFFFQASFLTEEGLFVRVDILERLADGSWHLYEVKSSSSVKTDAAHNHIKDAGFQKYVLTECGYEVSKVSVIHVNKDYIKRGEINPAGLLKITAITQQVNEQHEETASEIRSALELLTMNKAFDGCSCLNKTRSNHCDAFDYLNPKLGEHSIYELNRIGIKNITELRKMGVMLIRDIPEDYRLTKKNKWQRESVILEKPIVEVAKIREALQSLKWPLHFIDYETHPSAIPKVDGLRPHQHLTFQVSIHSLEKSGELRHYEYLSPTMELPEKLVPFMKNATGTNGTFVSWHASFEKGRNKEMIELFPENKHYLEYINDHMFDLETVFCDHYVDYRFKGRTSIKSVLPVLVPDLSYDQLAIQDGTMALDTWGRWVSDATLSEEERNTIRQQLLDYCELDTMAMVEIYRHLKAL